MISIIINNFFYKIHNMSEFQKKKKKPMITKDLQLKNILRY